MSSNENETIGGRFKRLDGMRQARLDQSEQYAYYTIPSVFPRVDTGGDNGAAAVGMLDSLGAAAANNMANKLITTLFSPSRPFFRLIPNPLSDTAKQLKDLEADPANEAALKAAFAAFRADATKTEKAAVEHLEAIGHRTAATQMAKLLIITGDGVIKDNGTARPTVYTMRDYVCIKNTRGEDKLLIIRDSQMFFAFDDEHKAALQASRVPSPPAHQPGINNAALTATQTSSGAYKDNDDVTVYTQYELQGDGRVEVRQGTDNVDIPGEPRVIPQDEMEHTHLSWNWTLGENYGRGLVEDFAGAFFMVDTMSTTIARLAARIAAQKILVDPSSGVDIIELNSGTSESYISGRPDAIKTEKLADPQDIAVLEQVMAAHKRQISAAFLYQSGQVRDAERVTAQEIRENAAELEIAHGGVYSRFAADWQAVTARQAIAALGDKLSADVSPKIVTGMDSLSRYGEMQNVRIWLEDLALTNQLSDDMRAKLDLTAYAEFSAQQRGVDYKAMVKTLEQLKAEQEALQAREDQVAQSEQQGQMQQAAMKGA